MTARSSLTVVLAAGEGTRMRSSLPKVLSILLLVFYNRASRSYGGAARLAGRRHVHEEVDVLLDLAEVLVDVPAVALPGVDGLREHWSRSPRLIWINQERNHLRLLFLLLKRGNPLP